MSTKQYTVQKAPEGYWADAKGVLTPVDIIKPIDKERDALVGELVELAINLHSALAEFKLKSFADIQAFVDLSGEQYGVKRGGKKGNVTLYSYDGQYKVQRGMQENIVFDERLQAAKSLIDECLSDWTEGARPEIHAIISQAFSVDKEGNINTARVLALRRLEIADERWNKAMDAISESTQVVGSKAYIRVYERIGDSDEYKPISLDIASV